MTYKVLSEDLEELAYIAKFEENLDISDTRQLTELVIRRRKRIIKRVDRKKSRAAAKSWKTNKKERTKTIKKWHKSVAGKRFHKQLGRFNSDRLRRDSNKMEEYTTRDMIALTSLKTNLLIFSEYVEVHLDDQVNRILFVEESISAIDRVSQNLLGEQLDDDIKLITQLLNPVQIKNLCETDRDKYTYLSLALKEVMI